MGIVLALSDRIFAGSKDEGIAGMVGNLALRFDAVKNVSANSMDQGASASFFSRAKIRASRKATDPLLAAGENFLQG